MSKQLTNEDKRKFIEQSLTTLTDEQKKIICGTADVEKQYTKVQRYIRIRTEGQKQEQKYLLNLAIKYRQILEGLDCLEQKLWTDEKKIKAFTDVLETYCDKGVELVEENSRRRLEHLKAKREQQQKTFELECARIDKEIKELKAKIGDKEINSTIVTEVSLVQ